VRGRRLVARRQADHAVELRALHGDLHVVHHQVATRQHVAALGTGADDEVAWRRRPDFEGQAAGVADGFFHDLGDPVQVAEADGQLRRAVDDGDLRLEEVVAGNAEGLPLGSADCLARRARLEVAAKRTAKVCHAAILRREPGAGSREPGAGKNQR
jgi:hypothetical protein